MEKLDPKDEKYLIALKKRLGGSSNSKIVIKKIVEKSETDEDSLKPKIAIHQRKQEIKPTPKIIVEEKPKQEEPEPIFKEVIEEKKFDDDLIEIKKVEIKQPEFLEVTPKVTKKQESKKITETKNEEEQESKEYELNKKERIEELTEWEIETYKKEQVTEEESVPCFIPIEKPEEKEEPQDSIIESQTKEIVFIEPPTKEEPIESKEIKPEQPVETDLEKEKKKEAFKEIESIDEQTALLLYDNGYTNIDSLKIATVKDLKKIKGIKKKKAKQIKKEVDEKANEVFGYKPIESQETEKIEINEEQVKEIDENAIPNEEKITAFNEMKTIDEKTAILLYDNGYKDMDSLKNITLDELSKIPGIKKRKAKKIVYEIEEKILESADLKPIPIDETAELELNEKQINDEKMVFEEEKDDDYKVEFNPQDAKWAPVEEEQDFKEEKLKEPEENKDIEKKKEAFKEIESIDEQAAILLYDNGYIDIDSLKNATVKDLKKIKGIKKKKAKSIIFEIESRFKLIESDKALTEEYDVEYFQEEPDEDLKKVDEKIKKFEEPENKQDQEDTEFFQEEIEDVPEIKLDEKDKTVFREIESIDDKICSLLLKNGIDTLEKLNNTSVKELIKIKGIRKKIAKQIKKEVEFNIKAHRNEYEEYENIKENPYIKTEDDQTEEEWESIDSRKKASKIQRTMYGFMYNEYTLYEKEITTKSGSKRLVRFFSKGEPEDAKPIDIPEGYEVDENKSGVPYLRKIKD